MLTLRHKQIIEDSSLCRIAPPDYLLVFRQAGDNAVSITHAGGLRNYIGERSIPAPLVRKYAGWKGDQKKNLLSHWIWRQYASPVWMDIRRKRMLPYKGSKEVQEEKHVCPLQLDVIERCLVLWSNPGDVVLSPFMGIGSEIYGAVESGRRGIGIELKASYYRQALRNVKAGVEARAAAVEAEEKLKPKTLMEKVGLLDSLPDEKPLNEQPDYLGFDQHGAEVLK